MTDILMPALSPTMEEGVLAKWHVKVGDTVKAGDVIAEIETDKATMEVEAVDEGEVLEILVAEGAENVKVNTPIARLAGEDSAADSAPKAEAPAAAPVERRRRRPVRQAGHLQHRRHHEMVPARRAHLSYALRRSVVDGHPVGRYPAEGRHRARAADR